MKITIPTIAIQFIAIVIISLFLFKQCQTNASKNEEIARLEQNAKAADATLKTYIAKNGNLVTEISGYVLDAKKDKARIQELLGENFKAKGTIAALNAKIYEYEHKKVPTNVIQTTDSTGFITAKDSMVYDKNNYTKFDVSVPYTLSIDKKTVKTPAGGDSIGMKPVLSTGEAVINKETAMELYAHFTEVKGQIKVFVETPNKSIKIGELQGGVLSGKDLPKSMRMEARKTWGFGYSVGVGMGYQPFNNMLMPVVYVGIGLNYTPKKIQF